MGRHGVFQRHPRKTLAAAALAALAVALGLAEAATVSFLSHRHQRQRLRAHARAAISTGGASIRAGSSGARTRTPGRSYFDRANGGGWRDRKRALDKPDGVYRILALGDSNTFGFIVPAEKTYTRMLEDRLRADGIDAEVLNMGVAGWGTDQALEALRRDGVLHQPDLVIVQFDENDLGENLRYRDTGKFGRRVPFYYQVVENGEARRRDNPRFREEL